MHACVCVWCVCVMCGVCVCVWCVCVRVCGVYVCVSVWCECVCGMYVCVSICVCVCVCVSHYRLESTENSSQISHILDHLGNDILQVIHCHTGSVCRRWQHWAQIWRLEHMRNTDFNYLKVHQ